MWLSAYRSIFHKKQIHITTLSVLWSISHLIPHSRTNPTSKSKLIELKYHKGHLWDYLCAWMLLEPQCPEECNTKKTASLQRKKKKKMKLWFAICSIWFLVPFLFCYYYLVLCSMSLVFRRFHCCHRDRNKKRGRFRMFLWVFGS